ncbi:MAG: hypothetical protein IT204_16330 [Fimbriimonadaceae bacterium]|nr:hypothetical protein [Fimbriimonadaceae bacterium]
MIRDMESALDALALRQKTVANNLANLNTPQFKRSDVDFFSTMREIFAGGEATATAVEDTTSPERLDGNNVTLEQEVFALSQTDVLYQATSRFTTGMLQRMSYVISDGRS